MQILNIAGYKFTPLSELSGLATYLDKLCIDLSCLGTILLSTEGININLAGDQASLRKFISALHEISAFVDITFRESFSIIQPFKRIKVKIKDEIITMRRPEIRPEITRAPTISATEFKQWLDEARDITIVDTRNGYEVRFGTFKTAEHVAINDFSEFPEQVNTLAKTKPVVTFCTGGIRCEKAALHLLNAGFPEVYQLEGGILNYFAETDGEHFIGECFVFDKRIAVNAALCETGTKQCIICEGPLRLASPDSEATSCISCRDSFTI